MKKRTAKNLRVGRETLRPLDSAALKRPVGGGETDGCADYNTTGPFKRWKTDVND